MTVRASCCTTGSDQAGSVGCEAAGSADKTTKLQTSNSHSLSSAAGIALLVRLGARARLSAVKREC
jgi:hypothetical protein